LLETHQLGMGNLERYVSEVGARPDDVIVEDYWLVIPSTMEEGNATLQVGLLSWAPPGVVSAAHNTVELTSLQVDGAGE